MLRFGASNSDRLIPCIVLLQSQDQSSDQNWKGCLYISMHSKFHQLEHDSACTSAVQVSCGSGYHLINIFSESSRHWRFLLSFSPTQQSGTRCLLSLLRFAWCWLTTSTARSLTPAHGFRMMAVGVRTPQGILEIPTEALYMG